jgi:hypothetical protein
LRSNPGKHDGTENRRVFHQPEIFLQPSWSARVMSPMLSHIFFAALFYQALLCLL